MKKIFGYVFLIFIIAAIIGAYYLWQDKQQYLASPINLSEKINFEIESGSNLKDVLNELAEKNIISKPEYILFEAKRSNQANLIKAGEYQLLPGTTPTQLIQQFIDGKVVQYRITLIDGWNYRQVFEAVKNHKRLKQTIDELSVKEIMEKLELEGVHPEGQFYPDTYSFPNGTSDIDFLKRANKRLHKVLEEEWQQKAENLPYQSAYEALIMASIIEKETAASEERPEIAGVFVRRLLKDMKLQTDPTVIYAIGESFDGDIRKKDLSIDSPYNTYVYKGLPPTPISIAGRAAINAALHPNDGKTLFFVSMGNGKHYFSETLKEHNQAVRKYILKK